MTEEAKVISLEDWGIFDNESQASLPKNKTPNKKQKKEKKEKLEEEEEIDTSTTKKKNKKIKLKPKERNEKENLEEESKNNNNQNSVYKTIYTYMKNVQPDASKSIKRKTYELLKNFVAENDLDDDSYDLIIKGSEKNEILGLCELISKKTRTGSFKGSTFEFLKIVHYWFRDIEEEKSKKMVENFSLNEDCIKLMKLGEHYSRLCNSTKKEEKKLSHQIIHILKDILDMRKTLELKDLIKFGFIDTIQKGLDKYEAALQKKKAKEQQIKEEEIKENNIEEKNEKEKEKEEEEHIKNMDEDYNPISLEPRTWEAAEKMGKKLLTVDFLAYNRSGDDVGGDLEFIENFIDPLNENKKLNIGDYPEDDIKKLHIQMDTFDPIFFLEKIYKKMSLSDFASAIINLDENLKIINDKDEKLIDKNIYKYLDCKKLLDSILTKFNENSSALINSFNTQAASLQSSVNNKLIDIKKSFDQILRAKMCKEIINKLSKYFKLKDEIEENLKFSNIDELADILKRVNVELKNISQNKLIYGEFYIYFSQKIDDFKNKLIEIIKNAPVTENLLKYFKYLLEFQLETKTVEQLLNLEKIKMCDKIKIYLENTENFEINNYRDFFCDEYPSQNINDNVYMSIIKQAENELIENSAKNPKPKKKKIYDNILNTKSYNNNIVSQTEKKIMEELDKPREELINVESIIKSILDDINEFLFTMKVLDEMISMKSIYNNRTIKFNSIATEIYFVLFEKLKIFLFDQNSFNMDNIINQHYTSLYTKLPSNNYITKIETFYRNEKDIKNILYNGKFNKNNLQNLSNLVVEIFEKFEYHLTNDILTTLKENKSLFIKKIFYAFINEQIISNLSFFIHENTISYTDTKITIFNQSSFNYTKDFLKRLTQSYISIIKFYMNIVNKISNIYLEYDLIYDSFFFVLKCFIFRFLAFYRTEKKTNNDILSLNCLLIETYRNLNYMQNITNIILKKLFKNKEKDYSAYLKDFNEFIKFNKNLYLKQYSVNASNHLILVFINNNDFILEQNSHKEDAIIINKFYEKFNEILSGKNNGINCFSDYRSCFIDLLNGFSTCLRDLDTLFQEENISGENKDKKITKMLQFILGLFFDKFIQNTASSSPNIKIFLGLNDKQKNLDAYKFNTQLLVEMELLIRIVKKYLNDKLVEKGNICKNIILGFLGKIKGLGGNASEKNILTNDEIKMKNILINNFMPNYESFYKIFN